MIASDFEQFQDKKLKYSGINKSGSSSIVRFCTKCGSRIEDDNKFCTECGFPVEVDAEDNYENVEEENKNKSRKIPSISINSDRIKAALEQRNNIASDNKKNETKELFRIPEIPNNLFLTSEKKNAKHDILGYYVFKNQERSEYLVIENIEGSKVTGYLTEKFSDNSYANESFEGTLKDDALVLNITGWDLHPAPQTIHTEYSSNCITKSIEKKIIRRDISFLGIVHENEISGLWILEDGKLPVSYTKT